MYENKSNLIYLQVQDSGSDGYRRRGKKLFPIEKEEDENDLERETRVDNTKMVFMYSDKTIRSSETKPKRNGTKLNYTTNFLRAHKIY